jgi:hypothetical protein
VWNTPEIEEFFMPAGISLPAFGGQWRRLFLRERCGFGAWQNAGKRVTKPSFS